MVIFDMIFIIKIKLCWLNKDEEIDESLTVPCLGACNEFWLEIPTSSGTFILSIQ